MKDEKTDKVSIFIKFFSFNKLMISVFENHLNFLLTLIFFFTKVTMFEFFLLKYLKACSVCKEKFLFFLLKYTK